MQHYSLVFTSSTVFLFGLPRPVKGVTWIWETFISHWNFTFCALGLCCCIQTSHCCRKLLLQQSLIEIWSLPSKSPKTLKWYNSSGHLGNFTLLEILYIILFSSFIEKYDLEIWKYVFQCNHMLYGYPHALICTLFLLRFHFQFLFLK